jgi:hypothetical protein
MRVPGGRHPNDIILMVTWHICRVGAAVQGKHPLTAWHVKNPKSPICQLSKLNIHQLARRVEDPRSTGHELARLLLTHLRGLEVPPWAPAHNEMRRPLARTTAWNLQVPRPPTGQT